MKKYLNELYKRKDLIINLVLSGLKAQHRNSFLGYFWWLLDPLLGALIFYIVVVVIFHRGDKPDYGVYLVIGMIVWRSLASTVSSASRSIVSQAGIINQVYLPKSIFPLCASLTQLINFAFGLLVIAIFLTFSNIMPGIQLLWLPVIITVHFLFLLCIALIFAFICVFVRDTEIAANHMMRLWFFGTPVIWYREMIPQKGQWLIDINPMSHFLSSYRDVFIHNSRPDFFTLSLIGIISLVLITLIIYYYRSHEHRIIKSL
jgi:ABC-type polysaccharide/polyol phosphate export permease